MNEAPESFGERRSTRRGHAVALVGTAVAGFVMVNDDGTERMADEGPSTIPRPDPLAPSRCRAPLREQVVGG